MSNPSVGWGGVSGPLEQVESMHLAAPSVTVNTRVLAAVLWIATAIILSLGIAREVILHLIGTETVLKDLRHFALDSEHSLPVWYESLLMAAASLMTAALAALARCRGPRDRLPWIVLAVAFIAMSLDESAAFHEATMAPLRKAANLSGALYFSWVLLAAPLLVILGMYFIPFLLRLPRATAARFVLAGALFVGGAFGMEFVGGYYVSIGGYDYLPYKIAATTEEALEAVGMTLFVTSLLAYAADTTPAFSLKLANRSGAFRP